VSQSVAQPVERKRHFIRIIAPAVGLLTAGLLVWQGSYAAFSATTTDNSNAWSTGNLVLTNNGGTGTYAGATTATFGGTNLKPTSNGTTCLTVKSTGNSAGSLAMYRNALADSTPSLGAQIQLTVTAATVTSDVLANCTGFPTSGTTTIATGVPLTTFPTTFAGATTQVAVAATNPILVAYKIVWTFVTTGTNPGDTALMGKTVTAGFTWELQ
jgi:hypothetical protein